MPTSKPTEESLVIARKWCLYDTDVHQLHPCQWCDELALAIDEAKREAVGCVACKSIRGLIIQRSDPLCPEHRARMLEQHDYIARKRVREAELKGAREARRKLTDPEAIDPDSFAYAIATLEAERDELRAKLAEAQKDTAIAIYGQCGCAIGYIKTPESIDSGATFPCLECGNPITFSFFDAATQATETTTTENQ